MVLYFAGFQRHYSIYQATARVVAALESELTGLLHSKATIRFPLDGAVPTRLIARIAKLRAAEVAELETVKAAKRTESKKAKASPRRKLAKPRARKR
jgi:uncharacterized protein YdhG (YjbR/CyaY superfamily)